MLEDISGAVPAIDDNRSLKAAIVSFSSKSTGCRASVPVDTCTTRPRLVQVGLFHFLPFSPVLIRFTFFIALRVTGRARVRKIEKESKRLCRCVISYFIILYYITFFVMTRGARKAICQHRGASHCWPFGPTDRWPGGFCNHVTVSNSYSFCTVHAFPSPSFVKVRDKE